MQVDTTLPPVNLNKVTGIAKAAETMGFDAIWTTETSHDPFLPGALVAEHTQRLMTGTGIAVAFARSPTTLAYTAWDLAQASQGRFILGLGTQVKAHIERRFGMPWPESVVNKLRDQVQAIRALWDTWQNGTPLKFRGEYYRLSLMSPFFDPGPIRFPHIPIYLAGVNPGLAKLAGEIADGFLVHPLHTPRYLREVLLPAIQSGIHKAGRQEDVIAISATAFVATSTEERNKAREQIAFYAATPSYRPVMKLHGWEETAEKLSGLAARGKWETMPGLITDEMLDQFVVQDKINRVGDLLAYRYTDLVDRINVYIPFVPGEREEFWHSILSIKS